MYILDLAKIPFALQLSPCLRYGSSRNDDCQQILEYMNRSLSAMEISLCVTPYIYIYI